MQLIKNEREHPGLSDFTNWSFEPSDDYADDCATGHRLASEFLAFQKDPAFAPSLGWVVQSIAKLDRSLSGLETGFFHELNSYLATVSVPDAAPNLRVIEGGRA